MDIEKGKISKGFTYPLKSSLLAKLMSDAGINVNTHLIFDRNHVPFEAFYWLPNQNVEYERFYIRTGAVQKTDAKIAKEYLVNKVLPEFVCWASELLDLPDNSPKLQEKLHFCRQIE